MDSFLHISNWLNMAKELANPNATIIVVGNKNDLKEERVISFNEASKFCQENEIMYIESSAFLGQGIEELFFTLSKSILNKVEEGKILLENGTNVSNKVNIYKSQPTVNTKGGYCSSSC